MDDHNVLINLIYTVIFGVS